MSNYENPASDIESDASMITNGKSTLPARANKSRSAGAKADTIVKVIFYYLFVCAFIFLLFYFALSSKSPAIAKDEANKVSGNLNLRGGSTAENICIDVSNFVSN